MVAADGTWDMGNIVGDIKNDPDLAKAISAIGYVVFHGVHVFMFMGCGCVAN